MQVVKLSIKEIAEFAGRGGHITNEFNTNVRALEGTHIHQEIQKSQDHNYHSEVMINYEYQQDYIKYIFQGRMDGLMINGQDICIDEIKSTTKNINEIDQGQVIKSHYYQLILYAFMYSDLHQLKSINCRLTYVNVESREKKYIYYTYSINELENKFHSILEKVHRFVLLYFESKQHRNQSLNKLQFPYQQFRQGQKELMKGVYYSIKNHQKLFINASTGLGKTLATIYPSLLAMKNDYTQKILYLTAKSITKTVAYEAIKMLIDNGLYLKTIIINAKDHMCFLDKRDCHPDMCPYANGHYDRVNDALFDMLSCEMIMDKESIIRYSLKYKVCPFEFSLDLFLFCDFSILDYNYAFDPRVYLERAYQPAYQLTLLVDEAHNLIERARSMYSATLCLSEIAIFKQYMQKYDSMIYKQLIKIEDYFIQLHEKLGQEYYSVSLHPPIEFITQINRLIMMMQNYLSKSKIEDDKVMECYFNCVSFYRIYEFYFDGYKTYVLNEQEDIIIKMFCIDPGVLLKKFYLQCQSVIFFSATLLPIQYYFDVLGGSENDLKLYYPSPFNQNNKQIIIGKDINTRYQQRHYSILDICNYIYTTISAKTGNYIVFFSSYDYMDQVYSVFINNYLDIKAFKQNKTLSNEEKTEFLNQFKLQLQHSQIFFCVLGGMFSEGIDFKGEQLIGTIIVGVGLPQLSLERDLIKDYYGKRGYDYAYKYPGMNKVLQAAGRVIRTHDDQGVIILLDDRYESQTYLHMFPVDWNHYISTDLNHFNEVLNDCWLKIKNNKTLD